MSWVSGKVQEPSKLSQTTVCRKKHTVFDSRDAYCKGFYVEKMVKGSIRRSHSKFVCLKDVRSAQQM